MVRRVLVTGAAGQLAAELIMTFAQPEYEVLAPSRPELDIGDAGAVQHVLTAYQPHIILNTAVYNRVDDAEDDPISAFAVNALGPRNLARAAQDLNDTILVHYSTDYVFDGRSTHPYEEGDLPQPLNTYGVSKLAGEYFVCADAPKAYILRVSAVFGPAGQRTRHGNFVQRMLALATAGRHLRVVRDQIVCPTYAPDIARVTRALIEARPTGGVYHCAGVGSCSFYQFAQEIFRVSGTHASLEPVTSTEYHTPARRPLNSVLSTAKLIGCGITPPRHWQQALLDYFGASEHL